MITIGYTNYDAALSFSWRVHATKHTGSIARTRVLRNTRFLKDLYELRDRVVLHAIFSGYEGTALEPNIPDVDAKMEALFAITERCLTPLQTVLVLDPVIPTQQGIEKLQKILDIAPANIRVRLSFLRQTEKLVAAMDKLEAQGHQVARVPWDTVGVPVQYKQATIALLSKWENKFHSFHCCCEPYVDAIFREGCVSETDYKAMRISRHFYGNYISEDDSCCCARSKVVMEDPIAVVKCVWNNNL